MSAVASFPCPYSPCPFIFLTKNDLNKHIKDVHSRVIVESAKENLPECNIQDKPIMEYLLQEMLNHPELDRVQHSRPAPPEPSKRFDVVGPESANKRLPHPLEDMKVIFPDFSFTSHNDGDNVVVEMWLKSIGRS